ncbi:MAG: polysaccharide pyruvyl transferase family protein, partial [Thermodesulfobacteriota bacterium]
YALDLSPSLVEKIRAYAKARGKRVLSVGYRNAWADENVVNLSPFELLGYYQNADFVFTDMFHGTIFSVLANKNFILQISGYRTNKFHPMLDVLHVRDRVFDGGNADALLADEIDYRRINIKVREFKKTGLRFLAEALGGDE